MELFSDQISFIDELELQVFQELEATIKKFEHILKDYIVEKQLFEQGIDGNSKKLEGYTRTTIRLKIRKGQPVDRTTTRDTEKFHASIQIDAFPDRFEVTSNVPYDKYITKRYGKDILTITRENMNEFFNLYFLPNLKKYVDTKFAR